MKVKTISYSESREEVYGFGLKKWKKLGMEAELEDGDVLEHSVGTLKEYVKENISDESESQPTFHPPTEEDTTPRTTTEGLLKDIKSCKELKVLESYRLIAKQDPILQTAYDKKLNELS